MSKRESRSSLGSRQNDALLEFESFKKKFLLANKHITKLNSTLSVRIEELNAQISSLYVENLRLRASEIALASQLKREREKSRKIMAEAETATLNLTKHFSYLRQTFNISQSPPSPAIPTSPRARKRPPKPNPNSEYPQFPRLSKPPNVPEIFEEDEPYPSSSEEEAPPPSPVRTKLKSKSRLPTSSFPFGSLTGKAQGPIEEKEIAPGTNHLMEVDIEVSQVQIPIKRRKSTGKEKEKEKADELSKAIEPAQVPEPRKRTKEKLEESGTDGGAKLCLKDVTNPRTALSSIGNTVRNHIVELPAYLERFPLPTTSSSPVLPADDESANGARERRVRKSVNYAEPKLNTKMRKPEPSSGSLPPTKRKRSSVSAVPTLPFNVIVEDNGNDADNDTEARSSLEQPTPSYPRLDNSVINPAAYPLPSSRPGSTSSYASNPISQSSATAVGSSSTLTLKRKKSKAYVLPGYDEEDSDGAQADNEYHFPGKGWVNEGRRRSGTRKYAPLVEDERRHSAAV